MPVFAVIGLSDDGRLALAVQSKFPRHFKFGPGQYVVNSIGPTAHHIGYELGPTGQVGQFAVFDRGIVSREVGEELSEASPAVEKARHIPAGIGRRILPHAIPPNLSLRVPLAQEKTRTSRPNCCYTARPRTRVMKSWARS